VSPLLLFGLGHQSVLPAAYMLPLGEISLVSLTEPGLRSLHRYRQSTDVDLHLLAIGQQLYALSLQLLDAQALYLAGFLHVVHLPFWVAYTTLANLPQGRGGVFTQKG
jgi:hypothetical protein